MSADKKIVGTESVSENPYFTNSKLRLILKGGTERANLWLQFSACTKEGALSGVAHTAGFLDCKLNVQLTDNTKLTAGRFCVPFGLIDAHSTYNLPVGFYSTGIYHVLGKKLCA